MKLPERFAWALEVLDPAPMDTLLEIGCGTGLLAEAMAQRLTTGTLTALDRSAALIRQAHQRNARFVDAGTLQLVTGELSSLAAAPGTFDKAVAFNVSAFWKNPAPELSFLRRYLKPGGTFYLLHQPPTETTRATVERAVASLTQQGFQVEQVLFRELMPASAFCIISKPNLL